MTNQFRTARELLAATPLAKWVSILSSVAASCVTVLLIPVVYLAADVLVTGGRIPEFHQLPAAKQQVLPSAPPSPPYDNIPIEQHWRSNNHSFISKHVSVEAANRYLPPGRTVPSTEPVGVLATIARNEDHWSANLLGFFARWNPWMWSNGYYVFGLFIIASLLIVLRALFVNAAAYFSCGASCAAASKLRRNIYNHSYRIGALAIRPEMQAEAGELISNQVDHIQDGYLSWLTSSFRGPTLFVMALIGLLLVNIWVGIACLLLALSLWLVAGQVIHWFRIDARLATRRTESRLAMLRESLMHMQLAKSYLTERFSQTRIERHLGDLTRATRRRLRGETLSRQILFMLALLASSLLVFLASRAVMSGSMSVAGLTAQACALSMMLVGVNRWISARVRIRRANESAIRVYEFFELRGDGGQPVDAEFLPAITKKLDFVDVSYREPGTGRMVLDKVSFSIAAGSKTAIVCSDPDEALTIAYMLTRFIDPSGGEIRIDGKNARWVTIESLRLQVSMTLTDLTTFSDTVANNIACGDPSFTRPQIIEAAKAAHAHQFVQRLPYGYETILGDVGHSLLQGEKYRIALARSILHDPSVMILEEPFEPFDRDSVALIDDALVQQSHRTIIYLARRKRTIRGADQVIMIQDGKLVEGE